MDIKILIVDNEENVRTTLGDFFSKEGFHVAVANDSTQALKIVEETKPEIIVLDVQLNDSINGLDICNRVRGVLGEAVGIIMISGVKMDLIDRVVGLELGADAYMTKPFETRELLAQIRAVLRHIRLQKQNSKENGWVVVDNRLRINYNMRKVEVDRREVFLTAREYELLKFLSEKPGVAFGRSDLIDKVWGYEADGDLNDSLINVCVSRLRSKIELDPANPTYILSVRGYGYRFTSIEE
jgi:DNA-binding response OmpR family regulator